MDFVFPIFILLSILGVVILKSSPQSRKDECPNPHPDSCAARNLDVNTWMYQQLYVDPDRDRNTTLLIRAHGYPQQRIDVRTYDGYHLLMYRIRSSPKSPARQGKPAVLIMHGLFGASHDWFLNPRGHNLPEMLADAGYDVFIGNNRGTSYSDVCDKYTKEQPEFWDFSWHNMGYRDTPAMINRILEITKQKKVFYVGFSQGTTQFLVMLSTRPGMNDKVYMGALLAPVAFMEHCNNTVVNVLAAQQPIANAYFGLVNGDFGFPVDGGRFRYFACNNYVTSRAVCARFIWEVAGFNECETNCTRVPLYMSHDPDHCSFKSTWHYAQLKASKKFREWDPRPIGDDSIDPPPKDYNLKNIRVPISLYNGREDILTNWTDVNKLARQLRSNGVLKNHYTNEFQHADFYWAIHVKREVFSKVLTEFNNFPKT